MFAGAAQLAPLAPRPQPGAPSTRAGHAVCLPTWVSRQIFRRGKQMENRDVSGDVLRALADAYPQPVHFGYLSLALGVSSGAMWRALTDLRRDALITVD